MQIVGFFSGSDKFLNLSCYLQTKSAFIIKGTFYFFGFLWHFYNCSSWFTGSWDKREAWQEWLDPLKHRFANPALDLRELLFMGFVVLIWKTERLSYHFKGKHFFSAVIIKDGIGSANPIHIEGNFVLKVSSLQGGKWMKWFLWMNIFFISYMKTNWKPNVDFYSCDESWWAAENNFSLRHNLFSNTYLISSDGKQSKGCLELWRVFGID